MVIHYTIHAYASWLPDREEGFVHRTEGPRLRSDALAQKYRGLQRESQAWFERNAQHVILEALQVTCAAQCRILYGVATEPSHFHVLVGWRNDDPPDEVRRRLKNAVSQQFNRDVRRRTWLSRGGDIERVETDQHFDQLIEKYFPEHRGLKWDWEQGAYE